MMMSRLCQIAKIAMLAIITLWLGHGAVRAEIATGWVGDIPVPVDALIETDSAVTFDSPSGRVIRFTFQVAMTEDAIDAYYKQALVGLGWQVSDVASGDASGSFYQRGTEVMRIAPFKASSASGGRGAYQVTLAPADSAAFQ